MTRKRISVTTLIIMTKFYQGLTMYQVLKQHLMCIVVFKPQNALWSTAPIQVWLEPTEASRGWVACPRSHDNGTGFWSSIMSLRDNVLLMAMLYCFLNSRGPCCFLLLLEFPRCHPFRDTSVLVCKAVLWHLWVQHPHQSHIKTKMVKALQASSYTVVTVSHVSQPCVRMRRE